MHLVILYSLVRPAWLNILFLLYCRSSPVVVLLIGCFRFQHALLDFFHIALLPLGVSTWCVVGWFSDFNDLGIRRVQWRLLGVVGRQCHCLSRLLFPFGLLSVLVFARSQ